MASRTGGNEALLVTITLLGLIAGATFILSLIFYGQKTKAEKDLQAERDSNRDVLRAAEREQLADLLVEANQSNQSLVGLLAGKYEDAMEITLGDRNADVEDLRRRFQTLDAGDGVWLVPLAAQQQQEITRLRSEVAQAQQSRDDALQDLQAEVDRVQRLQDDQGATVAALNSEIDRYKSELDQYRTSVEETIEGNNARVTRIRTNASETESGLRASIAGLEQQVVVQESVIEELRTEQQGDRLRATDEATLVDASIIGTDGPRRQAIINIGRENRVVLGMTMEIYSSGAAIRPDASGVYPRGKATVEVIKIDQTTSVTRIIREAAGNPIVTGDVAANAVYDPNKTYTFVIFGNFDANRDGLATPQERRNIESVISSWGGRLAEDIQGDTDFLVLGQRPIQPPQPPADAPIAVIQHYIDRQREASNYDRLFDIAIKTGIPVLNENRLYTLTGHSGAG